MSQWSNWDDAYANCIYQYDQVLTIAENTGTQLLTAWDKWTAGNDRYAIYWALQCIGNLIWGIRRLTTLPPDQQAEYAILYMVNENRSEADPYELTMQKIIETMWESNPLETFFFVNYIDGMRASIWNISIFEERLESIYTHFLSWE